ncbi:MAG TPA: Asp-tRNA(Asn)/Glu-tRNA(Gln) amidotransferase subunit GatC [Prosthecobacter sp.]|nr:Asp-tRNA(Asn)/Glu-tRNA(Gln) amidotransferase subunit GatC [Prosthecobacter sp.]
MPSPQIDIKKVATLARLALTDAELATYQEQLGGILNYIDKLSGYDLEAAEPTAHAMPVFDVLRPDEPRPGFSQEEAMANAPKQFAGQIQIPNSIEDRDQ